MAQIFKCGFTYLKIIYLVQEGLLTEAFKKMGSCFGSSDNNQPVDRERMRELQAQAAEKRIRENESRGIKNIDSVKRQQARREQTENLQTNQSGGLKYKSKLNEMLKKLAASGTNLKKALTKPLTKSKSCIKSNADYLNSNSSINKISEKLKSLSKSDRKLNTKKSLKSFLSSHSFKKKKLKNPRKIERSKSEISFEKLSFSDKTNVNDDIVIELENLSLDKVVNELNNQGDILKLSEKINDVKKTVTIYVKKLEDRGFKLEDLQKTSEKLNESTNDLKVVSEVTKKKTRNNNTENKHKLVIFLALSLCFIILACNVFFM